MEFKFGGIWSFCVLVAKNYSHQSSNSPNLTKSDQINEQYTIA